MSPHSVYVLPSAWAEIKALPGHMRQRVKRAVDARGVQPHPQPSKPLRTIGSGIELHRLRRGRWRVIYAVDDSAKAMYVGGSAATSLSI